MADEKGTFRSWRGWRYWLKAVIVAAVLTRVAWVPAHPENGIVVGVGILLFAGIIWEYVGLTSARLTVMRMGMCPECRGPLGRCPCGKSRALR